MEVPRHWRLKKQRYEMQGVKCGKCGMVMFPPRALCPNCEGIQASDLESITESVGMVTAAVLSDLQRIND